jgi:PAS domain S-box-containing protein
VRFEWILFGSLGLLLLGGVRVLQRRERSPNGYWIGGWIAAAIGGLLMLLGENHPALRALSFPFGTLFPWFLLAGALVLAERRVPRALFPVALGLGAVRTLLALALGEPVAYAAALATDLPVVLVSARFAGQAVPREGPSRTQRLLAPGLLVLAAGGGLHLLWSATRAPIDWILTLWMLATPPLLGLQLRVGSEWNRREIDRARRDLERTIAERTSELARVNESLRASEERYRTVSELGSDLSFSFRVRRDGSLEGEWVTDAFERITGYRVREMARDRWLALIHPEDREPVLQHFRAALREGRTNIGPFVFRVARRDGGVRWLEARERVTRDAGGLRVVGAGRDISDAREAEAEAHRLERQMQEAQRLESLGLVTGGVAHDFSNVLTVILGNVRLALAELPAAHPLRPRLERALAAAEHGAGLTQQMLVYAGRGPRAQKPVNLSALVGDMLDLTRAAVPAHVQLRESLAPDVWVLGDETQLRQVVLNLVANAGEAIGARGGTIELGTAIIQADADELACARGGARLVPGRYALLQVVDDGPGMDAATQERVFEPFFSTKLSGRGLGLAAVLGIVRGHGGAVGVESVPGRGSRFHVLLPCAAAAHDAAPEPVAPAGPRSRAARVLVIDDQEPVLELARELLGRAGYAVETALGGRRGLTCFEANPARFDAVLLDLAMPDLDGGQVGAAIRALRPGVPLLLVSGFGADLGSERLAALQPAAFLPKPYGREELAAALGRLLAEREGAEGAPPAGR